jgi:Fur family transcriptional regulator, ferric uptake regulator
MAAMATETAPRAFGEQGRRDTRQRRALREHLEGSDAFVSAQQLYDELRTAGDRVGLATVYRTLQAMQEAGEVDAVRLEEGETLYRKCGPRHHHHLVCRSCGVTVELDGPNVERWATKAADDHGFTDVKHVVELFGLCAECSAKDAASA